MWLVGCVALAPGILFGEDGLIDVVAAVRTLPGFRAWCRVGSWSLVWPLKLQRGERDEGGLLDGVGHPAVVRLLKAGLCPPGWLCRGVAAELA